MCKSVNRQNEKQTDNPQTINNVHVHVFTYYTQ